MYFILPQIEEALQKLFNCGLLTWSMLQFFIRSQEGYTIVIELNPSNNLSLIIYFLLCDGVYSSAEYSNNFLNTIFMCMLSFLFYLFRLIRVVSLCLAAEFYPYLEVAYVRYN